jgi:uncharacterized SAM-binding protein YcdF (DUF218 family)
MIRFLKRLLAVLLVLAVLAVAGYIYRAPLLLGAARAWVVNDPLSRADAIVVLGGGMETRPFEAARLYHLGLAPKVLLTATKPEPSEQLGLNPPETEIARRILEKKDVPDSAIAVTPGFVNSTYDEAVAVRNWAKMNHIKRLIIATDVFHTRRAGWLFRKELKPLGIQVQMDAVPVREYSLNNWWQHGPGVVAFQNEILKYLYYRVKY